MRLHEQIYNAFWILLSGAICVLSVQLTLWDASGPGGGFIPFLAGALIGATGLALFVLEFAKGIRDRRPEAFFPNSLAIRRILFVLGALCFMALTIAHLGFLISAFLAICFLLRAVEPQKWTTIVVIALASSLGSYYLFNGLLQVPLPAGILGF
jgi:hypothetical protein